jgi:hypothetical protein
MSTIDLQEKDKKIRELEKLRSDEIEFYNLRNVDEHYTFYYDETNNIRKLHIKGGRFNVIELRDFVLGGFAHKGAGVEYDLHQLRADLNLHKNITDIKLKHIAQGDFLSLIKSKKMTIFFQWLQDNKLVVHYHHLDPFYWSIVDIIDSIIAGIDDPSITESQQVLKCDLYEVLKFHTSVVLDIFNKYHYPDIADGKIYAFIK